MKLTVLQVWFFALLLPTITATAGPYKPIGVCGYIDPNNHCRPANPILESGGNPNAPLNTIFRGWASEVTEYSPAPGVAYQWQFTELALGPVTGQKVDVVSLGDLDADKIATGVQPGRITLYFADANQIQDVNGYDFVIFENAFVAEDSNEMHGYVMGHIFAELGYVEVSTDGVYFARFPSVSLTAGLVGDYGTIDQTDAHNLAGIHPNADGLCFGTPFDLIELANEPNVTNGFVNLDDIRYVKIIDIPGSGDFNDSAWQFIDPQTYPNWDFYDTNHPVYDCWVTYGSGGFDLEAIGVLHPQNCSADINLDGIVDMFDFTLLADAWYSRFGEEKYRRRCDLAQPEDFFIDEKDLAKLVSQWLAEEAWSAQKF